MNVPMSAPLPVIHAQGEAVRLDVAVLSEMGGRTYNEDTCAQWTAPYGSFFVLADGAGGHRGGKLASRMAVNRVMTSLRAMKEVSAVAIERAISDANAALVTEQKARERYSQMRTTLVVLAIDEKTGRAAWGHIGDSRLYCVRDGKILVQTRDHSVVQAMVDAGYLKPQQMRSSPDRNKLLNALGDEDNFEPAIQRDAFTVAKGDRFVLCTDGVWEYVEENEIEQTAAASASAEEWLKTLQALVLSRAKRKHDNYSAIAVCCAPVD
jgi:serine/threonine protein phosphatase PrpC